jgi:hypothetical protein
MSKWMGVLATRLQLAALITYLVRGASTVLVEQTGTVSPFIRVLSMAIGPEHVHTS